MAQLPIIEIECTAGRILRAAGYDTGGNRLAEFRCRYCGKVKAKRHAKLVSGELKSCGCERTRGQSVFQQEFVAGMSETRCRRIADLVATEGENAAAAREGLWPITIDFARRRAEAWLWSLDVQEIYELAQRNFKQACDSYKLMRSEVVYIVNRMRRMDAAVRQWWASLSEADRCERQTDLADMTNGIASALRSLKQRTHGPSSPWCNGPDFGMAVFVA
jgi:hypothetical protein